MCVMNENNHIFKHQNEPSLLGFSSDHMIAIDLCEETDKKLESGVDINIVAKTINRFLVEKKKEGKNNLITEILHEFGRCKTNTVYPLLKNPLNK